MDRNTERVMQPVRQHMETYVNDWIKEKNPDIAERLHNISSAMHRMEEELNKNHEEELARLVQSGADSLDSISRQVKEGDARDIIDILEKQGREHPAGALLASITAGFLSTRAVRHKKGNGGTHSGDYGHGTPRLSD